MVARRVSATDPVAVGLVAAMVDELEQLYGSRVDVPGTPSASPEDLSPPGGAFVVLADGDTVLAGGGLKRVDERTGEVKRMYVDPAARGRGAARALLAALEDAARELGYTRMRLDTGPLQHHAKALYLSAGYVEIAPYNVNVYADFWAEKEL